MNLYPQRSRAPDEPADNSTLRVGKSNGLVAIAALAGGLAVALAACGTAAHPSAGLTSPHPTSVTTTAQYAYYRSMMRGYVGGMMGGGNRWAMSPAGYRWMTGVTGVPGWMSGGKLPEFMMGVGTDPGTIMGHLWAHAPGPRVTPAQASRLATQIPAGAKVNRPGRVITFTTTSVRFVVVASPPGGPDEAFRIAGLINPRLVIPAGARVSIELINADPSMAHGLVITAIRDSGSWMPMMTSGPAFAGSALWFLGDSTAAGMHVGTITFSATTPGTYRYLCPVPGHARNGLAGLLVITR